MAGVRGTKRRLDLDSGSPGPAVDVSTAAGCVLFLVLKPMVML
jgi:hypothetical protein